MCVFICVSVCTADMMKSLKCIGSCPCVCHFGICFASSCGWCLSGFTGSRVLCLYVLPRQSGGGDLIMVEDISLTYGQ